MMVMDKHIFEKNSFFNKKLMGLLLLLSISSAIPCVASNDPWRDELSFQDNLKNDVVHVWNKIKKVPTTLFTLGAALMMSQLDISVMGVSSYIVMKNILKILPLSIGVDRALQPRCRRKLCSCIKGEEAVIMRLLGSILLNQVI